jgi:hypothetical protein
MSAKQISERVEAAALVAWIEVRPTMIHAPAHRVLGFMNAGA